jgi:hypothetical protein
MEPVNGLTALAAMLRQKAADVRSEITKSKRGAAAADISSPGLEQRLRIKLRSTKIGRAGDVKPAARVVVTEILAEEFSEAIRNEPRFIALVDKVCALIQEDASLKTHFERLLGDLTD